MIIEKLHKRVEFKIPIYSDESKKDIRTEAKGNASIVMHNLLNDVDLKAGDAMTLDVKVLIERNG